MLLIYTVHVWASHVSRWLMTLIQISCLFRCFWKFTVADCKTRCCEVQTRFDKRFYLASDRDESGSHSSQKHAKALFVSWSVSMCVYIYTLYIYIHYVYIYIHNIYIHTLYIYITGFLPFMKRIRVPKLRFRPASSGLPGPPASFAERISQSQVLGQGVETTSCWWIPWDFNITWNTWNL
jgi:hypothetical protein